MRAGIEIAGWWVAGLLIWTATLSSITGSELLAGALAALLAAVLARTGRRAMNRESERRTGHDNRGGPGSSRPEGLPLWKELPRWAVLVPVASVLDLVRLGGNPGALAAGHPAGRRLEQRRLPAGTGRAATTWRQAAVLAVSATTGTLVVDVDGEHGSMRVDPLVSGWPHLDRRVSG